MYYAVTKFIDWNTAETAFATEFPGWIMSLVGAAFLALDFNSYITGNEWLEDIFFKSNSEINEGFVNIKYDLEKEISQGNEKIMEWNDKIDDYNKQKNIFKEKLSKLNYFVDNEESLIDNQIKLLEFENIIDDIIIKKITNDAKEKYQYLYSEDNTNVFYNLFNKYSAKIKQDKSDIDKKLVSIRKNYVNFDKPMFLKLLSGSVYMKSENINVFITKANFEWYNYDDSFSA
ncbi:hypothetical protein [Spiroplasma endosymbiont of Labia minor]|uniref:hypothetical protein n=1 Tax=Spiroplasma endosymbiont of Labia minor TaxID=3066305 RepID=UPI0030CE876B